MKEEKYYNEIKDILISNEIYKKVKEYSKNRNDLESYYNVGKLLSEAGKHYGEGIIKEYSKKLTSELGKGYTQTRLRYFRRFYNVFSKYPTLSDKLTYSHYCELLSIKNINEINYYIDITIQQNLSYRQLRERIKQKEYERLPETTKNKLITKEETNITDYIKDPIIIKNKLNKEEISEKVLQQLIMEDVESFMNQLGNGYSFIGSEYKIKIGNTYNYIDILLFNYIYNSFVVVELKVTELKKEHIGQIQVYMNYVDNNIKRISQEKTIGLIIVRRNNKYIIEYSSDSRILSKEYNIV